MLRTKNDLNIEPFMLHDLNQTTHKLPMSGKVKIFDNYFSYLDIDDNFIHQIYPLIHHKKIEKPNYFDEDSHFIGAHISITYPEEGINIDQCESGQLLSFEIEGMFTAWLLEKKYYVLKVRSPDLLNLRLTYGLSSKLRFKGYFVDFHITVAVSLADE